MAENIGRAGQRSLVLGSLDDPRTLWQTRRSRVDLERRYVFLCPTKLNKDFPTLPQQAKDSALLVFKCSREWCLGNAENPRRKRVTPRIDCGTDRGSKDKRRARSADRGSSLDPGLAGCECSPEFAAWLLTKEREGCVFWFKPERDLEKLSKFFLDKIDPISERPYRPLLLDPAWWRVKFIRSAARYVHNPAVIISTITDHTTGMHRDYLDMAAMQELIYQSNPTLEPVQRWPYAPSMHSTPKVPKARSMVGMEVACKGFIDPCRRQNIEEDSSLPAGVRAMQERTRIDIWPEKSPMRIDSLHTKWQTDNSICHRHNCMGMSPLQFHGCNMLGERDGFPKDRIAFQMPHWPPATTHDDTYSRRVHELASRTPHVSGLSARDY